MSTPDERREYYTNAAGDLGAVIGLLDDEGFAVDPDDIAEYGQVVYDRGELGTLCAAQKILFRLVGEEHVDIVSGDEY